MLALFQMPQAMTTVIAPESRCPEGRARFITQAEEMVTSTVYPKDPGETLPHQKDRPHPGVSSHPRGVRGLGGQLI